MKTNLYGSLVSNTFATSAGDVLKFLNKALGFDLWVITRANGKDYIVLESEDHGYNTPAGSTFKWSDTFCSRMVTGKGPNFAANIESVTAFKNAPFAKMTQVGSYMGVPIHLSDGSLFGTLCAIHPSVKDEAIGQQLPMVTTFAELLGDMLDAEMKAINEQRRAEYAEAEAMKDEVCKNLYNRRGWDKLTQAEEQRAKKYGHHLSVLSIDLDNLKTLNDTYGHARGSAYIAAAGRAIKAVTRPKDIAARVGGDEFFVLLVECNLQEAKKVVKRLEKKFAKEGVAASIGIAGLDHTDTLAAATHEADQDMYVNKRAKKAEASHASDMKKIVEKFF